MTLKDVAILQTSNNYRIVLLKILKFIFPIAHWVEFNINNCQWLKLLNKRLRTAICEYFRRLHVINNLFKLLGKTVVRERSIVRTLFDCAGMGFPVLNLAPGYKNCKSFVRTSQTNKRIIKWKQIYLSKSAKCGKILFPSRSKIWQLFQPNAH